MNPLNRALHGALAVAAVSLAAAAHAQAPPAKIALTGGTIIPVVGEPIEGGAILIEHGRITAIGTDVDLPYDAMEIDCTGKVLMPGMIEPHSSGGLDISNENLPVTPFLDVYDAMDPSRSAFENALRDGITTVHVIPGDDTVIGGLSRAVRPIGLTPDEMTIQPQVAMKLSITPKRGYDRMRQMAEMREAFLDLADYELRLAEQVYEKDLESKGEDIAVGPAEAAELGRALMSDDDYDDQHRNLMRLKRGDYMTWIYCGNAMDVHTALELADDQNLLDQTVLVLGTECFKAVDDVEDSGRPVVLDANLLHRERDPLTNELEETFVPKVFHDAGVLFALQPNPDDSMAERYLNYQAALCVRYGIPREDALAAITINPAIMMGLDDRLGSLEVGKRGNVTVMSGDPLDFSSWVEQVYIDGILAYDRATDPRLEELLKIEGSAETEEVDDGGDVDGDDGGDAGDDAAGGDSGDDDDSDSVGDGDGDGDVDGGGS